MPWEPKKRCPYGHKYEPGNVIIAKAKRWRKKTGDWKVFEAQRCLKCTRLLWRLRKQKIRREAAASRSTSASRPPESRPGAGSAPPARESVSNRAGSRNETSR